MPRYAYVSRVLCLRIINTSHMDTNIGSILPRKRQHRDISTPYSSVCEKNKRTNYLYCIFGQMPRYAYVSRVLCFRIIDASHMDTNIWSILPRKRQHRDISTQYAWVCEKNKTTNYLYCIFGQMPRYAYVSRVLCLRIIDTSHMDTNIGSNLPRKRQHRDISTTYAWVCEKNKTTNYLYCIFGQMPRYAYVSRVLCLRIIDTSHMDTNIGSILPRKRQDRDILTPYAWVCEKKQNNKLSVLHIRTNAQVCLRIQGLCLRIIDTLSGEATLS